MSREAEQQLFAQNLEAHRKYTYFLLAAAASALAFAVQKSEGSALSWQLLPLALAGLSWIGSFYCGVRQIEWGQAALQANISLLQLHSGVHPDQPPSAAFTAAAIEIVRATFKENADRAHNYVRWQLRFLWAGGVCFLAWHVWRIVAP